MSFLEHNLLLDQFPDNNSTYFVDENMEIKSEPILIIIDQPIDKYRFRYGTEWIGAHGSLGSKNTEKKQGPSVKLENFSGQSAVIRCTLSTTNENRRVIHAHRLVTKHINPDNTYDEFYEIEVNENNNWTATFNGLGIIQTRKKDVESELINKMQHECLEKLKYESNNNNIKKLSTQEVNNIKKNAKEIKNWMDLNNVALCFRAYKFDDNKNLHPITHPIYSEPIKNPKSVSTGELKICKIDKVSGSCEGNEEVFLLVKKVSKQTIKVKFFENDVNDKEIWCSYGKFTELDVHHQYAIVFQTPAYKDCKITEDKVVWIQLERTTDGDTSEPIQFTYKPIDSIRLGKRPRSSLSECNDPYLSEPTDYSLFSSRINDLEEIYFEPVTYDENFLDTDGETCTSPKPSLSSSSVDDNKFASCILNNIMNVMETPLHYAVILNQPSIVQRLLKLGANPNLYDNLRSSVIHEAAKDNDKTDCLRLLIKAGANIEIEDATGKTPLHLAAQTGSIRALDILIKANADVNKIDRTCGRTALYIAVENRNMSIVNYLLKKTNININKKTYNGYTALDAAFAYESSVPLRDELIYLLQVNKATKGNENFNDDDNDNNSIENKPSNFDDKNRCKKNVRTYMTNFDASNSRVYAQNNYYCNPCYNINERIRNGYFIEDNENYNPIEKEFYKLNDNEIKILSEILNRNNDWKKFGEKIECPYSSTTCENPAKVILNYAVIEGYNFVRLHDLFIQLNMIEARDFIHQIIKRNAFKKINSPTDELYDINIS